MTTTDRTVYEDSSAFTSAPRVAGLTAHRDGGVLAVLQELGPKGDGWVRRLVDLDDDARVLTRGSASVGASALGPYGTVWFVAERPTDDPDDEHRAVLWALPPRGEARRVLARSGGIDRVAVGGGRVVLSGGVLPSAADEAEHERLAARRRKTKASAILHESFPVRYWDADLGPEAPALLVLDRPEEERPRENRPGEELSEQDRPEERSERNRPGEEPSGERAVEHADRPDAARGGQLDRGDRPGRPEEHATEHGDAPRPAPLRRLVLPEGRLDDWVLSPDGALVLATVSTVEGTREFYSTWSVPVDGGEPVLLVAGDERTHAMAVAVSPDGTKALVSRDDAWTPEQSVAVHLVAVDLATGDVTPVFPDFDLWPEEADFLDDGTLVCAADDRGRRSLWTGSLDAPAPRRMTDEDPETTPGAGWNYAQPRVVGGAVVALRSQVDAAPQPVRVDPATGRRTGLPTPAPFPPAPGRVVDVSAHGADGTPVRGWLTLPAEVPGGGAPLLTFVHGGPWGSNNDWSWRWNPWPFVARGYAVFLPDPAISTGYGQHMVDRGQQELGGAPFTDLMALVDAAEAREDVDASRSALLGGSYGGYMANWVAGHTGDRFRCVVTHASLWDVRSMGETTDNGEWASAMSVQWDEYSPHLFAERIRVPMLVIHGDRDYRVPIGQGQQLWHALRRHSPELGHRFLYFPDENHWILTPTNASIWYGTVAAFLDRHVLGEPWRRPELLG